MEKRIKKYSLRKVLKSMVSHLHASDRKIYFYFMAYTVTGALFPLFGILIPKYLIQALNAPTPQLLLILGIYFGASAITGVVEMYTNNSCYPRLTFLRMRYLYEQFKVMLNMDYRHYEDPNFQDENTLALEACSSNNNGVELIYHILFGLPARLLSIIFYIVIISRLSFWVLVTVVISVFMGFITSRFVEKYRYKKRKDLTRAARRRNYYYGVTHNFQYGKDIRLYQLQDNVTNNYNREIKNYLSIFKSFKNRELGWSLIDLGFLLLSDIVLYGFLIYRVLNGMSIADFSMYLGAALALSTTLKLIITDLSNMRYEGQYVNDLLLFIEKFSKKTPGAPITIDSETISVELKNVSFKYPKTDKYIIKDLNLTIPAGEKLAIVGINGAGKTTLIKLITRLFEIEEGELLINQKNAKDFDLSEYHRLFSVVFQDVHVYAFPLKNNVTMGHDYSDEYVLNCLIKAGLEDKVNELPKGLNQMMLKIIDDSGVEFSGGQNQKLAIARALCKNAKMVILDEPTASLDALAEAEIYEKFNELIGGKTAIYISHRLASTKFCDKIALFNQNGLVEYGTHDELMALKGEYYQMFMAQGQYYQEQEQIA